MPKLVITSNRLLKVGQVYPDLRDPHGVARPEQVFRVIGESTQEEWINCLVAFGEEDRGWAELLSILNPYFYEIQTD